jgi:hypothetical protein
MSEYRNEIIAQGMLDTTPSMTPKQKLIEAVKNYRTLAKDDLAAARDEYDKLGAETCIFDCQHFLILIEEILP